MGNFAHRPLSGPERWISEYEAFVEELSNGYDLCIYEYTNDLACRDFLEEGRETPGVAEVWARVESTDQALRGLLLPTLRCFHGDRPESWFWSWGYPRNSPELEGDLRSLGLIREGT